jgi:hypothetical protein
MKEYPKKNGFCIMKLRFGPAQYRLVAHDAWGRKAISRLARNAKTSPFTGTPDRIFHLLEFRSSGDEYVETGAGLLPDRLADLIPGRSPMRGWRRIGDDFGCFYWTHPRSGHALWASDTSFEGTPPSFWLPWPLMVEDAIRMGGGLFHGGLAVLQGRGYLFTAPAGGGKTTALSRMPRPWRVLADDAALVWPSGHGTFLASPLPTWGNLVRNEKGPLRAMRWRVSEAVRVSGLFLLKKAPHERLIPFPPLRTARPLYLAFSEHPTVSRDRDPFRKQIFRTACALARAVPSWKLELTRGGKFWHIIEDMLSDAEEA